MSLCTAFCVTMSCPFAARDRTTQVQEKRGAINCCENTVKASLNIILVINVHIHCFKVIHLN